MRRRQVILILVGLLVALVVAFVVWPGEREPEYQGKRLSEWLRLASSSGQWDQRRPLNADSISEAQKRKSEAEAAVRAIGTNGLPCLLRWVCHTEPRWKYRAYTTFYRLPPAFRVHFIERQISPYDWDRRNYLALRAFYILGLQGAPAAPELGRLAADGRNLDVSRQAMACLLSLGDPGIEELRKLASASDPRISGNATNFLAHGNFVAK